MIPTHESNQTSKKEIIVNQLKQLNDYDFNAAHRHNYFEFFYFIKGGGTHKIDFIDFPIKEGSVHIVGPGQVHQMNRALCSEGFVFLFELNALEAPIQIENFLFEHICLDATENNPTFTFNNDQHSILEQKAKTIWHLHKDNSELSTLALRNEIHAFCIACMKQEKTIDPIKSSQYMAFRKLLHANFSTMKKVKDYAKALTVSERSLNEVVKKNTGKSASAIIYRQITMEAKRLLNTRMSIKETAYCLNFDDPGHFSKFFKTQTGLAPSEFQNLK